MDNMIKFLNIFVLLLSLSGFFLLSKQDQSPSKVLELAETIEKDFNREFTKYVQTGVVSEQLSSIYNVLKLPTELRYNEMSDLPETTSVSIKSTKCYSQKFNNPKLI